MSLARWMRVPARRATGAAGGSTTGGRAPSSCVPVLVATAAECIATPAACRNHARAYTSATASASSTSLGASLSTPSPRRSFAYRPDPTPGEREKASTIAAAVAAKPVAPMPHTSPHHRAQSTSISDVLSSYQSDGRTFTCLASQSLHEAVSIMVSSRVGCLVAMQDDGEHVAGLVTERDILSQMVALESAGGETPTAWRTTKVSDAMTSSREMVHIRPADRIDDALALMTSQGFRHLPVLDSGECGANHLRGIVSMRNLVDILYKQQSAGGKAQFLTDVLPRTGVPKNTSLRKKVPQGAAAGLDARDTYRSLYLNAGVAFLPHPDKKSGEDAYVAFLGDVKSPSKTHSGATTTDAPKPGQQPLSVIAVFDGVGSWSFEQGIDPSKFANECARALKAWIDDHPFISGATREPVDQQAVASLSPSSMMDAAWKAVTSEKIIGSSTACILSMTHYSNELRCANIGDSGYLVLRHRDAHVRVGSVGHHLGPTSDYQVIFRSPQQLHYFNCPLQLGVAPSKDAGGETDKAAFESPADADHLTTPVQEGDIVVLATDGLFDNVPEEIILSTLSDAMAKVSRESLGKPSAASLPFQSLTNATPPPSSSALKPVADALAKVAYELSIDKTIDSPFAVLAKENNILWKNGGRKDDITVIVARVDAIPRVEL